MSGSKKFRNNFIKVTLVLNKPGNAQLVCYIYAPTIIAIGPCTEDHTKIGASTMIERPDATMFVTEHHEDVLQMLENVEID